MRHECKPCDGTGGIAVTRLPNSPNAYQDEVVCSACGGHGGWCDECETLMNEDAVRCPNCGEPAKAIEIDEDEPALLLTKKMLVMEVK